MLLVIKNSLLQQTPTLRQWMFHLRKLLHEVWQDPAHHTVTPSLPTHHLKLLTLEVFSGDGGSGKLGVLLPLLPLLQDVTLEIIPLPALRK
ncbi:hypothetical protein HDU96_003088, partial [Phlyctochytrium bullatum]